MFNFVVRTVATGGQWWLTPFVYRYNTGTWRLKLEIETLNLSPYNSPFCTMQNLGVLHHFASGPYRKWYHMNSFNIISIPLTIITWTNVGRCSLRFRSWKMSYHQRKQIHFLVVIETNNALKKGNMMLWNEKVSRFPTVVEWPMLFFRPRYVFGNGWHEIIIFY